MAWGLALTHTLASVQAVLIADSFKRRMSPVTYSTPKCLLPVVNIPLINYALEAIISAGSLPRFST
jgi:NDP-sugar pyrophosphorylase family protein